MVPRLPAPRVIAALRASRAPGGPRGPAPRRLPVGRQDLRGGRPVGCPVSMRADLPVLRLRRCPRCEYDLGALPARHRCPECGFEYDPAMFVLEGWHVPDVRRSFGRLVLSACVLAAALAFIGVSFALPRIVVISAFLGAVAAYVVLDLYVRLRHGSRSRALVRYLISEHGVSRVGAAGGGRIYLWRNYSHLMLLPDGQGAWRIHLYPSWWHLLGPPIVNARLECDESDAEAVRAEIQRRISAAKRAEAGQRPR